MMKTEISFKIIMIGAVCAAALMGAGCVSLLPEPVAAPSVYRLTSAPISVTPLPDAPVVRIAVPISPKALQGTDIVVSPDGYRLAAASGARWSQPLPKLLQDAVVQALGQRDTITPIAPPTSARADYALETNVRAFEAAFDKGETSPPLVKFRISATLTDLTNRKIVCKREFYAEQRSGEIRVTKIVETLDGLTRTVMADMSDWIAQTLASPGPAS